MFLRNLKNTLIRRNSDRVYACAAKWVRASFFNSFDESQLPALTAGEKARILDKWGAVIPDPSIGYYAFRVFKKFDRFNPDYVPEPYFQPYIMRSLNPTADHEALQNKCLADLLFHGLHTPRIIARRPGIGNTLDGAFNPLAEEDLIRLLAERSEPFIIKPAKDSNSGHGVQLIQPGMSASDVRHLLSGYPDNFVIQEVVRQSRFTAGFNPTSLNTFRVMTLYINNRQSVLTTMIRMGGKGKVVDNFCNGGLFAGVDPDGRMTGSGITIDNEILKSYNGIDLAGERVPNFDKVKEMALEAHRRIPMCGLVAWDIALDINDLPCLIEANLWWPVLSYVEVCNGPIFGDRTDEVIDFVRNHPPRLIPVTPRV